MVAVTVMHRRSFSCFILLILFATGCDPMTGVVRTVRVKQLPSNESVEAALRDVSEITKIELHQIPERKAFSVLEGKILEPAYSQFDYFTRNDGGILEVKVTKDGAKVVELRRISLGSTPRDVCDRNRILMDKIYASLRKHSPDLPPQIDTAEKLIRIRDK
jgi:hypothetical protein